MNHETYQKIRAYCYQDLQGYIDTPERNAVLDEFVTLASGRYGIARIKHEQEVAHDLLGCLDLTPREDAAARLLAIVSNHRAITWQREPRPPSGKKPAPPLEKSMADALAKQTSDAVKKYAAFLPEPERAVLIADCETALTAAPAKAEAGAGTTPAPADKIPGKIPPTAIGKLAIKAAWQIEKETGKRATARQVIERLQSWVDHKDNREAVTELTEKIANGVKWVTCAGKENKYDIGACQKALGTWNKSRDKTRL